MDENKAGFLSSLRQFGRKWLVHLVICIGFIYVFSHMSLMRPLIPEPFYMEYVVAIFVLLFLYLHYFLFIPKFLLQKKYALYFIIALGSALVWSCCEVGFSGAERCLYHLAQSVQPQGTYCVVGEIRV